MDTVEVTTSSDERQGNFSDWADAAETEQPISGNEAACTAKDQPESVANPGDNGAPEHHIPSDKSNVKQGNGDLGGEMPRNPSAPNTDRRGVERRGRGYRYTRRGGRSWNQQRGQLSDRKYTSASPGDALPYRDKKQHKAEAVNEDMADDVDEDDDLPENEDGQHGDLNGKSKLSTSGDKLEESLLIPPPVSIRVSADDNDVFSIYYLCNLQFGSMLFWSVEQAYQWLKAVSVSSKEAAYAVFSAKKGTKTMSIAEQYFGDVDWSKWLHLRIPFMRQLLRAKARCCKPFTEELRKSGDSHIVVVLKDDKYWGIADGKGKNKMGSLLMELRTELDEALNADPEEDLKMINLPMNVAASSDGSRSHEMTVLLIGDSQLNGIDCEDLVPGVHLKKRIVPAIEETHQFIENEDLHDYHMVVLHLLSHDAVARCREDLLEALEQLTDVISKRMKIPKIIISLAVYPVFSREKEYSKLADDINNVLFTQGKDWLEVSFRTNGLRLTYEECFTPDGVISKKAEHLLRNNLADTIHHHLLYRKPSHLSSKPNKTSASCEIPQIEGPVEEQNKDGAKQEDPNKSAKVEIDEKLDPLKGKLTIVDRSHELSNYFQCDIYLYGIDFWSGEQAYQWRKAKFMGNKKAADEIYAARYANQASAIANRYFRNADMRGWQAQQIPVMQQMLRAKARCCKPFLDKLRTSGDSYIIIVMKGDNYWGIGNGKGKNIMGSLLMELRSNLDAALNAIPNEDGRMIDFGQERAARDDRDSEVAKVLVIGDSQLFGIDFNNLIQDVKVSKIITPSVEEAHHFIEKEDISKYDATLLHLLSKEMVCKPEEEVIQAMDDFTSVIRERMMVPKVIISLAIYPLLSPDEEYSNKADAINKELCEQFGDCSEVTFRRNGLRLKYEDCFTPDGTMSKRGEELLKNNLVDTIYHHLFGRQRYQRRHRWRMPRGEPSY